MKPCYINGDLIRRRRSELGEHSSVRSFARATHLSGPAVTAIETRHVISGGTTLAELNRIADHLGVPVTDLLHQPAADHAPTDPDPETDGDLGALARILANQTHLLDMTSIAAATGWTLDHVRKTRDRLDKHLRPLGMRVHTVNGARIGIRPLDSAQDPARDGIEQRRVAKFGMNTAQARLTRDILDGTFQPKTITTSTGPHLTALINLGVVEHQQRGGNGTYRLTDEAQYAFDLTEEH